MKEKLLKKILFVILMPSLLFILPTIAASEGSVAKQKKNFRDDFTGQAKRPEWRIQQEDKDRYAFVEGNYLLLVTKKPDVNRFVYDTANLPENFMATILVNEAPINVGQGFSLAIEQDNENILNLFMHVQSVDQERWAIVYRKNLKGEKSEYAKKSVFGYVIPRNHSLQLGLRRQGVEYTGAYRIGDGAWQEIGSHVFLNLKGLLHFKAFNFTDGAPESPVKIDFFEIKELK